MKTIEQRKKDWVKFADLSSNVNRLLVVECGENMPQRPPLWWENNNERIEYSYVRYQRQLENLATIHDSSVPYLTMVTGTEIFAQAFGCKVYKPEDNNPCAIPYVFNVSDLSKVKIPRLEDTKLYSLFEMADKLKTRAGKEALLGLPDVQTPMDIAALIWEKSDFFAAMYEEPQAIKELALKIKLFMFEFFDNWFKLYGAEHSAHYPDYYMPYGITISEDEIGTVSPEMYDEFFKEELEDFSNRYGAIGIHCCADSIHQWGKLKEIPNLKILNLCRDTQQTIESIECFRNVCAQMPGDSSVDLSLIKNSEQIHVANYIYANTKKQAVEAVKKFLV